VPHDPDVPGLESLTRPEALRHALGAVVPEAAGGATLSCDYVRWKPGQSAVAQVSIRHGDARRVALARACRRDAYAAALEKARASLRGGGTAPLVAGDGGSAVIVTPFPHDRAIPALRFLLDPDKLKRLIQAAVPGYAARGLRVKATGTELAIRSYSPERRCVVRGDLNLRGEDGAKAREVVWARMHDDDTPRHAFALLRALHAAADSGAPAPAPRGYDAEHRVLVVSDVPGASLEAAPDEAGFAAAGVALARIHSTRHRPERLRDAGVDLAEARELAARLFACGVAEAALLQAVARKLWETRPSAGDSACLHGDFHPGQALAHAGLVHVVDFDECGTGDPAIDLGWFVAHLPGLRRAGVFGDGAAAALERAFLESYAGAGGAVVRAGSLAWHRDLALLRMALSSVKHLEAGWPETVRALVGHVVA
jgi:aminoglycoside phosphotransferase (APT) family kinase protein